LTDLAAVTTGTTVTGATLETGEVNNGTITGAIIRTAVSGKRTEINSADNNEIEMYSGHADETAPGRVYSYAEAFGAITAVESPTVDSSPLATILLTTRVDLTPDSSTIYGYADEINWSGLNAGLFLHANGSIELLGNVAQEVNIYGGSLLFNDDDVVTKAASQTLTNKNLTSSTNTFPFRVATGNWLSAASIAHQTTAVVFPVGRFSAAPKVVATARTSADVVCQIAVSGETSSGFNLHFKRSGAATATNVGWIAIQD
jgi:hypothetical protein